MKSEAVKQFGLIIIESLPDNEAKTGYNLHKSTVLYKTFQEPNLNSEFYDINNRTDFFQLLKKLVHKAVIENHFFILHFEIHGYNDGVELKNSERISWEEMIPYFREINIHFHNFLAIYLAVCRGANIIKFINPLERAPFRVLISSEKDIYVHHLITGFEKFYEHFFFSYDAEEAVEEYNSIITDKKDRLVLVTSQYCFDTIADIERETADKPTLINRYKVFLYERNPYLKYFPDEYVEKIAEQELKKDFNNLKTKRDYFLMTDLQE
ncbi:hypothetical protein KBY58_07620 [Cyanobium sp. HWJ4-Hawea]|nr:hypothetical protein [Cyanobium sp. HWJ4-Hawea]